MIVPIQYRSHFGCEGVHKQIFALYFNKNIEKVGQTMGDEASCRQDEEQYERDMFVPSLLGDDWVDVDNDTRNIILCDVEYLAYNERDYEKYSR